ncbi:MAG: hypothetical protein WCL11_18195 [Verrucomicrobiota bacterium]
MKSISKRNQAIIQMRQEGVSRNDVASKYGLSSSRIALIEQESMPLS